MSSIDKKMISVLMIILLLVPVIMPSITLAAEGEINIKDSALADSIRLSADSNLDGIVTKEELENVSYVSISPEVESIEGLEDAKNLQSINIRYTGKQFDFSKLDLKDVYVSVTLEKEVTKVDLSFLKTIKNVSSVNISGGNTDNVTINYEVLRDIPTLTAVSIYGNDILPKNLDILSTLTNLTSLQLYGGGVNVQAKATADITGISKLSHLTDIYLNNIIVQNASELGKLQQLSNFYVSITNGLGDYSYLANAKNLQSVEIRSQEEVNLDFLKNKDSITSVVLYGEKVNNINVLTTLKNLEYLSMSDLTLTGADQYKNITFKDVNAYLGESGRVRTYFKDFPVELSNLFTFQSNNDVVTIVAGDTQASDGGYFNANKIGEATITATLKSDSSITKTFKIKVNGISADQALGTEMGSTFVDGQTVLKANGELWKIYASDEKAEKVATNVKKAVYNVVYTDETNGFPYSLLLKKDGSLEYTFNGVTSVLNDAKDIYQNGYLKNDGTYVEIQPDGTWKTVAGNVEKIVGSFLVKTDGKTYTVKNELVCNFPIVSASYNYVVDTSGILWEVYSDAEPIKKAENADYVVHHSIYVDKDGVYRYIYNGEKADYKLEGSSLKLDTNNVLTLGGKEILTHVTDYQRLAEFSNRNYTDRTIILREDGSIWALYLAGEAKLVQLQETENVYFKEGTLEPKEVYGDNYNGLVALTGFNVKELEVSKALSSNTLQSGYTAKAFDGTKQLQAGDNLFTGATIQIYNKEGKLVNEYVALIYGDVTGSGNPSAKDALMIIKNRTGKVKIPTSLQLEAARVTENTRKKGGEPNSSDALAIIKAKLGKYEIN